MADRKGNTPRRVQLLSRLERKYGLPRGILWGVYGAETGFGNNLSTSSAGAQGPFQFMPGTAAGMGVNPHKFSSAAKGAARYLANYKDRGTAGMLAAYNAGPAGNPNNPETQAYIPRVTGYAREAPYPVGVGGGGDGLDKVAKRAAKIANATTSYQHTDYTPSRTTVDKKGAIVDALLSSNPASAASGRLSMGGGLLGDIQQRIASGAYTTTTPESTKVTTVKERAAARAASGGKPNVKLKGGGYHGTEALVKQVVDPIAGIKASNYKRDPQHNASVGGSTTSDHLTANTRSYAADYGTTNGAPVAQKIAKGLGIKNYTPGNYNHYNVTIGGRRFRVQILWAVKGHYDHVHFGAQALD